MDLAGQPGVSAGRERKRLHLPRECGRHQKRRGGCGKGSAQDLPNSPRRVAGNGDEDPIGSTEAAFIRRRLTVRRAQPWGTMLAFCQGPGYEPRDRGHWFTETVVRGGRPHPVHDSPAGHVHAVVLCDVQPGANWSAKRPAVALGVQTEGGGDFCRHPAVWSHRGLLRLEPGEVPGGPPVGAEDQGAQVVRRPGVLGGIAGVLLKFGTGEVRRGGRGCRATGPVA